MPRILLFVSFFILPELSASQSFIEYSKFQGSTNSDNPISIQVVNGETYVLSRSTNPAWPITLQEIVVIKYGVGGNIVYSTTLDPGGQAVAYEMVIVNKEVYVTASTPSASFIGATNTFGGYQDIVVSKLGVNGEVLFSTYIGGNLLDYTYAGSLQVIANEIFLAGSSESTNFPLVNAAGNITYVQGGSFIAKLDATSGIILRTEVVGHGYINMLHVSDGSLILAGYFWDTQLPVTIGGLPSQAQSNNFHVYVKKINSNTFDLEYGLYLFGNSTEQTGYAVVVNGEVHVAGRTYSNDFPVTNNSVASPGYDSDGFYTRINSDGTIGFSTYLSSVENDLFYKILVTDGAVYLMGSSYLNTLDLWNLQVCKISNGVIKYLKRFPVFVEGDDNASFEVLQGEVFLSGKGVRAEFPVTNASQYIDRNTGYLTRINSTGEIVYSTFLGSMNKILPIQLIDSTFYILGSSSVANFPFTRINEMAGMNDNILVKYQAATSTFSATYLGGNNDDIPSDFKISGTDVYISGQTFSQDFPVTVNTNNQGNGDGYMTKIGFCPHKYLLSSDTLSPNVQTICKYGLGEIIKGVDLIVPSDSLPFLYLDNVIHYQDSIAGLHYQWQVATNLAGPWTDIAGAVLKDFTPVVGGVNQYYRRLAYSRAECGSELINISATASVFVNDLTAPAIDLPDPYFTCPGSPITIGGSQFVTGGNLPYQDYSWDMNLPGIAEPTVNPVHNTIYTLVVSDAMGCKQIAQALVLTHKADAGPDKISCEGSPVRIGSPPVAGLPAATYQWSPVSNLDNSSIPQPMANPVSSTDYILELTLTKSNNGTCITKDTVTVTPIAAPLTQDFAGPDVFLCSTDTITIGTLPEAGFAYQWSPQDYLINISGSRATFFGKQYSDPPPVPLTFTLTAERYGCFFNDQVTVVSITADAGPDLCGSGVNGVMIGMPDHTPLINETYSWVRLNGSATITGPSNLPQVHVSPSTGGSQFELTVSYNGLVCKDTVSIGNNCGCEIMVFAKYLCPSYSTNDGLVTLVALANIPNAVYEWTPTVGLSNYTNSAVQLTDTVMRVYTVKIYSATDTTIHCSASKLVNHPSMTRPEFPAPDVFTCANIPVNIGLPPQSGYTYQWTGAGLSSYTSSFPVAIVAGTTEFPVSVMNDGGCVLRDTVVVNVQNVPVNAGPDLIVCSNGIVKLGGLPQPNTNFVWEPQNSPWQNGTNQFSPQPEVLVATNITFTVAATSSAGCISSDDVTVIINNTPTIPDAPDVTICKGIQKRIGLPALPGVTYQWSPSAGLSNPNIAQPFANPAVTTTYTVTATFPGNCSLPATDNVTVTVSDPAFSMPDIYFCPSNGPVALGVNAPPNMSQYFWLPTQLVTSFSIQNPTTLNPPPGIEVAFQLRVRNSDGCYFTDTLSIIPTVIKPMAGLDRMVCKGESVLIGSNLNEQGAGITYSWSPSVNLSDATTPQALFTGASPGLFSYILTKTNASLSCISKDTVLITVDEVILPEIISPTVCMNSCVQIGIGASPGLQYQWSPSTGLSNASVSDPIACVTGVAVTYTLTATNVNGCSTSANIVVGVVPVPSPGVVVPDVHACLGDNNAVFVPSITGNGYSYLWSPDNGTLDNIYSPTPTVIISGTGTFPYQLQIIDNITGCSNTATANLYVTVCNPFATAGNFAWHDKNMNGIQDPGEPGFSNLPVKLFNNLGYNIASTITDANGMYSFNEISPGNGYYIVFNKPEGFGFTIQHAGGANATNDSKANVNGKTEIFNVIQGDIIDNMDAGLVPGSRTVPVTWLEFTARRENAVALLQWRTASEFNNDYFLVERSNDGTIFSGIGSVNGSGTVSDEVDYYFTDHDPLPGVNYYRLKQFDLDGNFDYSVTRAVNFHAGGTINVYHDQSSSSIRVRLSIAGGIRELKLVAANGQEISRLSSAANVTNHLFKIPHLASGVYFVQLVLKNSVHSEKILVRP